MKLLNATTWSYNWSYEVFRVNGTLKLLGSDWMLPNPPVGQPIPFQYEYLGSYHNETCTLTPSSPGF